MSLLRRLLFVKPTALSRQAVAILRSYGTNAHGLSPGANGVAISGLNSGNYTLSDGSTGYSAVDGTTGLALDAAGSVGSELCTDVGFDIPANWTLTQPTSGVVSVSGSQLRVNSSDGTLASAYNPVALTIGATYQVTLDVAAYTGSAAVYTSGATSVAIPAGTGVKTLFVVADGVVGLGVKRTATCDITLNSLSFKQVTGIHASQSTTANKPALRRGLYNLLLNSATPATQSVTCAASPYTLALYGTGSVALSGTGSGTLNGTGASDLVVLNFTPTAGSVTFTKSGTVSSFGLFQGTLTAAQILAEGGIPLTTSTAASNSGAGRYSWQFDGVNDSLLTGNLAITNAACITIAGRLDSLAATSVLFGEDTGGVSISVATNGAVSFDKLGTGALVTSSAGLVVAGTPFVLTCRLSGGTAVIRKNGTQSATSASGTTFSATTGARLGGTFAGASFCTGAISQVDVVVGAVTDVDALTLERNAASNLVAAPTF